MEATDRDPTYWGPERASYDDELDAWRERAADSRAAQRGHAFLGGLFGPVESPTHAAEPALRAQSAIEQPPSAALAA